MENAILYALQITCKSLTDLNVTARVKKSGHISQIRTSCARGETGGRITQWRNCVQGWNIYAVVSVRQEHCGKSSDLCIYKDTNRTTHWFEHVIIFTPWMRGGGGGVPAMITTTAQCMTWGGGGITDQFSCFSRSTNWQINKWTCRHFSKLDKASPSAAAWRR